MEAPRVTQRDVACAAGVDRSTVSLALRNHADIPPETRQRIQRIAKKLGYIPDPMLSAIAAYRNRKRDRPFQGTLAWLTNDVPPFVWSAVRMFQGYYIGAKRRALSYGFSLEIFPLKENGQTPARLARTLRARNIQGILVCPQSSPHARLSFPWDDFSAITFGFSLLEPQLHTVAPTQFRAVTQTMRKLKELGYKRIGFAYSPVVDERADHNFLGGYLTECFLNGGMVGLPPFDERYLDPVTFRKWFDQYKPDAILTGCPVFHDFVRKTGLRVPKQIGIASYVSSAPDQSLSGVCEDSEHSGEVAVDFLVSMIQQGHRGPPQRPHYIHIPGIWVRGTTLKYPKSNRG